MADADIDRLAFAPEPNRAAQASAFPDHGISAGEHRQAIVSTAGCRIRPCCLIVFSVTSITFSNENNQYCLLVEKDAVACGDPQSLTVNAKRNGEKP